MMRFSILRISIFLVCLHVEIQADMVQPDDCEVRTEFEIGYCPSTCDVRDEVHRFYDEMERYLRDQDFFLQEVKSDLIRLNATYVQHDPTKASDENSTLRDAMVKLSAEVSAQKRQYDAVRRKTDQLNSELQNLLRELETIRHHCLNFCNDNDDQITSPNAEPPDSRVNGGCGDDDDTLCLKAAQTASATMIRESEDGAVCPLFEAPQAKSCAELYSRGHRDSGIYRITPRKPVNSFYVFCDMDDSGGGWTVVQRRVDGSVDFNRTWAEYATGFGQASCSTEFWLGNENLVEIGKAGFQTTRIVMTDWDDVTRVAQYSYFKVNSAEHLYTVQLSYYEQDVSNCSDSMIISGPQTRAKFSSRDKKLHLTQSCLNSFEGWWADSCQGANLNGFYHEGTFDPRLQPTGIIWPSWRGRNYSLRKTEIKLRPYGFDGRS